MILILFTKQMEISMTEYELLSIRAQVVEGLDYAEAYWLSATFALIVAAYLTKGSLDIKAKYLMTFLYAGTSIVLLGRAAYAGAVIYELEALTTINQTVGHRLKEINATWVGMTRVALYLIGSCGTLWYAWQLPIGSPDDGPE